MYYTLYPFKGKDAENGGQLLPVLTAEEIREAEDLCSKISSTTQSVGSEKSQVCGW